MLKDRFSLHIGKIQILHFKSRRGIRLFFFSPGPVKPGPYLILIRLHPHGFHVHRLILGQNLTACMLHGCDIKGLPDALLLQYIFCKQLIRRSVRHNPSLSHHNNPVHIPVKGILQTVLYNKDGSLLLFLNLVDQINGTLSGSRVKVSQRLVKEQDVHVIHHDSRHGNPLLLTAGELPRSVAKELFYVHQLRSLIHLKKHILLRYIVIFKGKGNILRHSQPDKLPVRVLQYGSHNLGQTKKTQLRRVFAPDPESSRNVPGIRKGHKAVDTVGKGRFSAAGGAYDQNLLPGHNREIDIPESRFLLSTVFK